jgi:hypothetical protein
LKKASLFEKPAPLLLRASFLRVAQNVNYVYKAERMVNVGSQKAQKERPLAGGLLIISFGRHDFLKDELP